MAGFIVVTHWHKKLQERQHCCYCSNRGAHLLDVLRGVLLLVHLSTDGPAPHPRHLGGREVGGCSGHVIFLLVTGRGGGLALVFYLLLSTDEKRLITLDFWFMVIVTLPSLERSLSNVWASTGTNGDRHASRHATNSRLCKICCICNI